MTETGLRPSDAEMIAAFIDRRLSARERQEFLERLDREEALYEVFVETIRYREAAADEPAPVVRHTARGRRSWALPAAVAALLALAVALPLWFRAGDPARELVADGRLEGRLPSDWIDPGWSRSRGLTGLEMTETDRAFRVGVHVLDLEVALRLGRVDDAVGVLRGIDRELGGIDLSEPLRASYVGARERLEAGAGAGEALDLALEIEPLTAEFLDLDHGYRFGRWAETGKLAAMSENRELLTSRPFRKMSRELRAQPWAEPVEQRLELIGSTLDQRAGELDLEALAEAFTAVINET